VERPGKVIERLGHRVLELAAPATPIPLQLTAVIAGPSPPDAKSFRSLDARRPAASPQRAMPFTAWKLSGYAGSARSASRFRSPTATRG
jgi:hypothetical protein